MAKIATNQERLNELFDADPRSDSRIAEYLNVSKQTISAWRNGTRSPKQSKLEEIARLYHTTVDWLMGWDMPAPAYSIVESTLTEDELKLLDAYRAADERARSDALATLLQHPAVK